MKSCSFDAVAGPDARVLILGTLPGAVSLAHHQYYAHPRNAFWRIMGELVGASPDLPYADRLQQLIDHRIALWDVCGTARRPGSADAAIRPSSIRSNDLAGFLRSHTAIDLICFNGTKAGDLFQRHVLPKQKLPARAVRQVVLPSTSPAHAAMSFEKKLAKWRTALRTDICPETMNETCAQLGGQHDEFVQAASRRILRREKW